MGANRMVGFHPWLDAPPSGTVQATTGKATDTSPLRGAVVVVVDDDASGETRVVDADPTSDVPQPPRAMPVTPMAPRMLSVNILGLMVSLLGPDDKPPEVATGGLSRGLETGGDPPRPVVRPPPPSSPAPD